MNHFDFFKILTKEIYSKNISSSELAPLLSFTDNSLLLFLNRTLDFATGISLHIKKQFTLIIAQTIKLGFYMIFFRSNS